MTYPRLTQLAETLPSSVPFVGPEAQERQRGAPFAARLGANENGFGPSPQAVQAMQDSAGTAWMYGEPESHDLRSALADNLDVPMGNIVVGEGIDGLLGYLVRLLIEPGDSVVTSDGAYPTFNYHVQGFGGTLHKAPYVADHEDPSALLELAHRTSAKLIYLANPDNPMGTWHKAEVIDAMVQRLPEGCLLVLDEAYIETAPDGTAPVMDIRQTGLIRMRTFSKGYGLAGMRVGYAIGHADLIRSFEKIRNHFGMSRLGQIAALAALKDQAWLEQVQRDVTTSRARLSQIARDAGLKPLPSATNFVTMDCQKDAAFARSVLTHLVAAGIFVRMPFVSPQDRCIRVSCGPEKDMQAFESALPHALTAASQEQKSSHS